MKLRIASSPHDWKTVDTLVREYLEFLPFHVDFQDIETELTTLEVEYGPPDGFALIASRDETDVGMVALHRFSEHDAEMKRMFVRPEGRGFGVGRALAERTVATASALGYQRILLDTVTFLTAAIGLYQSLGFVEIEPYRHNPLAEARFYALTL